MCSSISFVLGRREATNLSNKKLKGLGIDNVGLTQQDKLSIDSILPHVSNTIVFWGISGKRTISNPAFKNWLDNLPKTKMKVRFLLLDPESPHLRRKAEDEGDDPEAWIKDIGATLVRITIICQKFPELAELRVFTDFPIWRVTFVDDKIAVVNYFPTGRQGPESPQIVLRKHSDSLFEPIYKEFLEVWNNRSRKLAP